MTSNEIVESLTEPQLKILHWIANHPASNPKSIGYIFDGYWGINETKYNLSWDELFSINIDDCKELVMLGFLKSREDTITDKGEKSYSFTINYSNYTVDIKNIVDELYNLRYPKKKIVDEVSCVINKDNVNNDNLLNPLGLIPLEDVIEEKIKKDVEHKQEVENKPELSALEKLNLMKNKIKQIEDKKKEELIKKDVEEEKVKDVEQVVNAEDDEW